MRLRGLLLELKTMILCIMGAQNVDQLQAIRRSDRFNDTSIIISHHDIVQNALNCLNPIYRVACRVYYNLDGDV